jgi:hypothetical protein
MDQAATAMSICKNQGGIQIHKEHHVDFPKAE